MTGKMIEDMILLKIQQKCSIQRDQTFDHVYKLDFIVNQFNSIHKLIPIGVQLTSHLDHIPKMREFFVCRQKKTLVDRSLYIEVHPDVDVDAWGTELIYAAIVSFVFQQELRQHDVYGVRINPDVTFNFFDIQKVAGFTDQQECIDIEKSAPAVVVKPAVKPAPVPLVISTTPVNPQIRIKKAAKPINGSGNENPLITQAKEIPVCKPDGHIIVYRQDKGFGFIEPTKGQSNLFFHVTNVTDEVYDEITKRSAAVFNSRGELKDPLPVTFEDVGYDGMDAKYPKAVNIKLCA